MNGRVAGAVTTFCAIPGNGATSIVYSPATSTSVEGFYVMETMGVIGSLTTNGVLSVLAGNGSYGYANGHGTNAMFGVSADQIAIDSSLTSLFVADYTNHVIRSVGTTTS
jgi:hypothetical protein